MKIRKCSECGQYTLLPECPKCKGDTRNPHPPKYSPEDRYGKYRRLAKETKE